MPSLRLYLQIQSPSEVLGVRTSVYGVGGIQLQLITACSFTGVFHGFPWWLRWQRICQQCRRPGFDPWVGKIHLEEKVAAHSKYSCQYALPCHIICLKYLHLCILLLLSPFKMLQ